MTLSRDDGVGAEAERTRNPTLERLLNAVDTATSRADSAATTAGAAASTAFGFVAAVDGGFGKADAISSSDSPWLSTQIAPLEAG